jgi:hypothetical protein
VVVGLSQGGRNLDGACPHRRLIGNTLVSLASELEIRRSPLIALCEFSHAAFNPHRVTLGVRLVPEVTFDGHCVR